jgi:hypothetical protein
MDYLPENVHDIVQSKPTSMDADKEGQVLYFHPRLGWYSANWTYVLHTGTTHWTYCPERPPVSDEDPKALRRKAFDAWASSFEIELTAPTKAFAELVWNAAWNKLKPVN